MDLRQKTIPLKNLTLDLQDVSKIFERLHQRVKAHGVQLVGTMEQPEDQTAKQWAEKKKDILEKAFRVTVSIIGPENDVLFGDKADVFTSPNRPDQVARVYMTNVSAFHNYTNGTKPADTFELLLDFSKPPIPDTRSVLTSPTPNDSNLQIATPNDAWLASIQDAVLEILNRRKNKRGFVHRAFIYDAGLIVFGLPFALYLSWKLSGPVNDMFGAKGPFLAAAPYIYLFFLAIWGYRLLFEYTRWAFPTVELRDERATTKLHRSFWYTIIVGLIGKTLYDVFL